MTADDADLAALRESVRKLLATTHPPPVRRRLLEDPVGYEPGTWRTMADLGLLGLSIPEEYGGSGASAAALQVVFEETGAALWPGPYLASVGLAVPALLAAGDPDARADYLPRIADGSLIATLATTEAGRGWELDDIATTARRRGDGGWTLSGAKAYVVDGGAADVVFVSARTGDGVGLFAVEAGGNGCSVVPAVSLDLTRRLATVELTDAPARAVGVDRDVAGDLVAARDLTMVALTGEQVGGAAAGLDLAVAYARGREQFGRPIGQFQAIKHLCAEMLVDLESAAALAHHLARAADAGEGVALAAAQAKALCSDVFFTVAARTIQVHGGIGFTWEHDAHLYYRRARSTQLMFGDAAWHRRRVLDLLDL